MIPSFINHLGGRILLLVGILIGMWIGILHLKQHVEDLKTRCTEIKLHHHQDNLHRTQLTKQIERIQQWHKQGKLNIFDPQIAENSLHTLAKEARLYVQDLHIKNDENKLFLEDPKNDGQQTDGPQFYCAAQVNAVLKTDSLENFYTFLDILSEKFPGIVVYKTIKISKITDSTQWVAFISFFSFNTDSGDYLISTASQKPIDSSSLSQEIASEENSPPLTFLLKGILYKTPDEWTIWLNDKKISEYFISDQLSITKVLPQEVHFILQNQEIIIVEVGGKFTLSSSSPKNDINNS
jgi:hypothetical protein